MSNMAGYRRHAPEDKEITPLAYPILGFYGNLEPTLLRSLSAFTRNSSIQDTPLHHAAWSKCRPTLVDTNECCPGASIPLNLNTTPVADIGWCQMSLCIGGLTHSGFKS